MRQYYEIRRAKTVVEISGARHGGVTVQKELSTVEANPTGGDRSKVHPADKYIEEGLAASVLDVSRAPSAMDPEVNDVAVDEA